ncbi:MAG: L,D-transpeptidase [Cyanobacteria bacterium RU_5_0]|nr:L,D-transpeptidase [Cyanobacteria bacterium RU_5_0]
MGKRLINLKRAGVTVGILLPAALQLLQPSRTQANPIAIETAQNQVNVQPNLGAVRFERLNQLVSWASPDLPPLGNPDLFLPSPEAVQPDLHLVIRLSDRRVYVYENDQMKTSFPIAIGRSGWETPTGSFEVLQMQPNPIWQNPFTGELIPPGSDNPLGSRWIGFWTDGNNYIGFHGTPNVDSVGQAASHGCIRMYDQDVIALFEMVEIGTPVEVVP